MLILLYSLRPAPAAGGINWDSVTAVGTLALAAVTLLTLAYAILTTSRDRKQAAVDRISADKRLEAERNAGEQRLKDERDHAAEVRRRDRQIDRIAVLAAHAVVAERAPAAVVCLDPFHVVKWGTEALDKLRRRLAAELRGAGKAGQASTIKGTRWALVKNPADLSPDQRGTLAQLARDNRQPCRGYLMKEQLRQIFAAGTVNGKALLAGLISWAAHSKIPEFAALARTLKGFRQLIGNTLDHKLSNGLAEGINTQLAALTVRARGFHSAAAFIAMANLTSGGLCPALPGRSA